MFSPKACEQLRSYVYLYIDPRTGEPFYVGKGQANRCLAHLKDNGEKQKVQRIRELKRLGLQPRVEVLKYGLTEREALLVEATAIDLIGIQHLTNEVRGHGSRNGSRGTIEQIQSMLDAKQVKITEPVMLINVSQEFRFDMTPQELYDATRSAWVVGAKREKAQLAMSIYRGVVREVYEIAGWVAGGSTMRVNDKDGRRRRIRGRWEFVGQVAHEKVRRRYMGRSVADYFRRGAQNPIKYVNCD